MKKMTPRILMMTLLVFLGGIQAFACSCRPPLDISYQDYFDADLIFEGTITDLVLNKEAFTKVATFQITENIKTAKGVQMVSISTASDGATCGLNFKKGQKWYLWARQNKDGSYTSGICSRSQQLPEDASEKYFERYNKEKAFLEEFKAKRGFQRLESPQGSAEGKMKKGKQCGTWKYYDANGKLEKTCTFKKGMLEECVSK